MIPKSKVMYIKVDKKIKKSITILKVFCLFLQNCPVYRPVAGSLRSHHILTICKVRILARVQESTLAKTPANESTRVHLDSRKLSDASHKLNTGESKDSCKLHPGESKWTLVALYEILPLI